MQKIKVIAFDADDTLWVNEPNFRKAEEVFCSLLKDYMPESSVSDELYVTEMKNLPIYGYGVKGFVLCMIETIIKITGNKGNTELIQKAIELGKDLLQKPVELLDGVEEVLKKLNGEYRIVVATKGDLLHQERKLVYSGLEKYFHHIEIMSDKKTGDYLKLLKNLNCSPDRFLMVGNSVKSDILPVLEIGGYAVHVPFHTNWIHELVDIKIDNPRFSEIAHIADLHNILKYL